MYSLFGTQIDLSSFDESTEEGRIAKFDATCKELRKWFFYGRLQPTMRIIFISKELADKSPYMHSIRNAVSIKYKIAPCQREGWNPETGSKVSLEEAIQEVKQALVEFSGTAMEYKKQRTTSFMMFPLTSDALAKNTEANGACEIVFWHLLASVYDDSNNQDLAKSEDLAFQIGFTKPMLRDWHKAVDYVLEGNIFDLDCKLRFESEEANIFFLHLYERQDLWGYDR